MSEEQKCCFCFPIECGVKTIAALIFLSTGISIINACLEEGGWSYYGYLIGIQVAMSIMWIVGFVSDRSARKSVFFAYTILIACAANIFYTYLILTGSLAERVCSKVDTSEFDSPDECTQGAQTMMMVDLVLSWTVNFYFSYVIYQWSQLEEGDEYKLP